MEDEGIGRKERGKEGRMKVKREKWRKEGREERAMEGKKQGRRKEGVNLNREEQHKG